jgi:hypothetical protein
MKKARQMKSKVMAMLIFFFTSRGLFIHKEFALAVTSAYYYDVLW